MPYVPLIMRGCIADTEGACAMVNVTGTLELLDPPVDAIVKELW
jgi:hypothetical protein